MSLTIPVTDPIEALAPLLAEENENANAETRPPNLTEATKLYNQARMGFAENPDLALDALDKALALGLDSPAVNAEIGFRLIEVGREKEAKAFLERAQIQSTHLEFDDLSLKIRQALHEDLQPEA